MQPPRIGEHRPRFLTAGHDRYTWHRTVLRSRPVPAATIGPSVPTLEFDPMPLDPYAEAFLLELARTRTPSLCELGVVEARQQMLAASRQLGPPLGQTTSYDLSIAVQGGKIGLRVYRPRLEPLPAVVYFHGGGWVVGSIETHDVFCRDLASSSDTAVISVDYRLAPEHKYPAAVQDAYAALSYVHQRALELGLLPGSLAVAGDSAGGNLAAACALLARDRAGPPLAMQVLIYPILDHNFNTASYAQCGEGYFLTRAVMEWFWSHYLPHAEAGQEPTASPLRATRLERLPPAVVLTAEYDPLRDEAEAYAQRLQAAGVPVLLRRFEGTIHGFIRRTRTWPVARAALQLLAGELAHLHRGRFEPSP